LDRLTGQPAQPATYCRATNTVPWRWVWENWLMAVPLRPNADVNMIESFSSALRTKAIVFPSGDHLGRESYAASIVKGNGLAELPTTFR
jgi:hypothetical protein